MKNGFAQEVAALPEGMDARFRPSHVWKKGRVGPVGDGAIFDGANYVLIPEPWNRKEHLELVKDMARELGCAHVLVVTAEDHDRAIAYTSDLTHVVATALMNSSSYSEKTKYFIGGLFGMAETRVADINGKAVDLPFPFQQR